MDENLKEQIAQWNSEGRYDLIIAALRKDDDREFSALTGNERLYITGLMTEFEEAKKKDTQKAKKILAALGFDEDSIQRNLLTNGARSRPCAL